MSDDLSLKLKLDLKPFLESLKKTEGFSRETIQKLQQMFGAVKPPKVTPDRQEFDQAVDSFKKKLLEFSTVTEESTQSIVSYMQVQGITESQMQQTISVLEKERSEVAIGSKAYNEKSIALQNLNNAYLSLVNRGGREAVNQFNRIGTSAQSLNYIIRDAPFFFQRVDMGIMAVSNNLNPFIDDLIRAKAATGSWRGAISGVTSSLVGIGGLSVAFSLIVAAVQAYSFWASNAKRETEKLKDEIGELKSELESASYVTLRRKEMELRMELLKAEAKAQKEVDEQYAKLQQRQQFATTRKEDLQPSAGTQSTINSLQKQIELVQDYIANLGLLGEIENRIAELREKQKHLVDPEEIKAVEQQITALQERAEELKGDINIKVELTFYENLTETQRQLKEELNQITADLRETNLPFETRMAMLDRMRDIISELTKNTIRFLALVDQLERPMDFSSAIEGKQFDVQFISPVPPPEVFEETNAQLEAQLMLIDSLTEGYNRAAGAVSTAMGASIRVFRQANSLLQIFINELIRAAIEAAALKLVMSALGLVSTAISVVTGGARAATSGGESGGGFAKGGLVTGQHGDDNILIRATAGEFVVNKESTEKYYDLINAINIKNIPGFNSGGMVTGHTPVRMIGSNPRGIIYQTIVQPIAIEVSGKIGNREIYLAGRKHQEFRNKYL
ncbi:MAG: hypothetical protein Kow0098_03780 [Ignavibacteriaceae bacterium]